MAGRGKKKVSLKDLDNILWVFGAYERRSFDDCDDNESNTIKNQRALIDSYITEKNNVKIIDYYIDDGYTGTNFERPGFKRLMQDIINGKINGIIVKDLSRLGRNHREVGKYIEEIFPIYNIRIISINDNVDSYKDPESINSLIVPIKNLMNEGYSRDISLKVSSAYKTMAKSGQYVAGTPPYGYMLDPNDKHHLIINEDEAIIVRKIFDMALAGDGRIKICKYLNENGILCRKEIQRRKKHNLTLEPFEIDSISYWGTTTIGRMLSSVTYIGDLAQLKTTRACFGSDKFVVKKEDEWIKTENTHEPIISKDMFNKVQEIVKNNEKSKKEISGYSIYNGFVKCGTCGRAMIKQEDFRGNRKISNFFCSTYLRAGNVCTSHKIKTEELEKILIDTISLQVKMVIELDRSLNKLLFMSNEEYLENEYKNNIKISKIKINNLKSKKRELYEEYKFNKIDRNAFKEEAEVIEKNIGLLLSDIERYESTYLETIKKIRKNDYWINHYKRNKKIKKITKKVLDELIENIYVFENNKVEVKFKYFDEYINLLNYYEREVETNNEKVDSRSLSKIFS